ncbi:hypothetical protein FOA52_003871 [Chlamydomonas sp. UWO 241]|nr:hypothetical protein FOA52_003871 [Chlamydomonas sp. UWO 241]
MQALEQLRARMASCPDGTPDNETLRWYLRDRSCDVVEAHAKLTKMLSWRRDFSRGSITEAMVAAERATGKSCVHSAPDVYGRPAILITARLHATGEFPLLASKRLCVSIIDEAISRLPSGPGSRGGSAGVHGEQIVGVFDLRGFQIPRNADFVFAAFMVEAFFEYYPKRVGQVLFVDAPWVFGPAWEVIRPLMRKYAALVRFVSIDELKREFFTPETLPLVFK